MMLPSDHLFCVGVGGIFALQVRRVGVCIIGPTQATCGKWCHTAVSHADARLKKSAIHIHHLNSNSPCTNSDASYPKQQFRESSNFSTGIPQHRAALSVSNKICKEETRSETASSSHALACAIQEAAFKEVTQLAVCE